MKYIAAVGVLALLLLSLGAQSPSANAVSGSGDPEMKTLIAEVRDLRRVVRQLVANNMQAQVILTEYRIKQELVSDREKELRSVQEQVSSIGDLSLNLEQAVQSFEVQLSQETDTTRQQELTDQVAVAKQSLEQARRQEQRIRNHENEMKRNVDLEREKLTELVRKLQLIEQEMAEKTA